MIILAYFLVFITGFTGLVYQILWQKYLSSILGSHAGATSLVLACFFLFMAAGYFVIGRFQHKTMKNKLLLYGVIEGLIGFYALISPQYFDFLFANIAFAGATPFANLLYSILAATLILALPTFLMGGTIPVLTQALVSSFSLSHKVHANIYSLNTFGAFAGALVAGFYFVETWGLGLSLTFTGFLNLAVLFITYVLYKRRPQEFQGIDVSASKAQVLGGGSKKSLEKWILCLISFVAGFYVFSFETILIKMAGIVLGATAYTYTVIVATFILSIAIGSRLVAKISRLNTYKYLYFVQLSLVLSSIALYFVVELWPMWVGRIYATIKPMAFNFALFQILFFAMFVICLIVPVGLMGMNLPLLFSYLKQKNKELAQVVGLLYGYNAVGSFFGAIVGGYWLYFYFDGPSVFKFSIALVLLNFLLIAVLLNRRFRVLNIFMILLSLSVLLAANPWDIHKFVPGSFQGSKISSSVKNFRSFYNNELKQRKKSKIMHDSYDPNLWSVVLETELPNSKEKNLELFLNAKPEASTVLDRHVRGLNAILPISLAPKIDDVFIVGLGASLSTGIVSNFSEVKSVDVAEISQSVVASLPIFSSSSYDLLKRMHKVKVFAIDAYRKLKESTREYDVIISEPTNLWVSGTDLLLTQEFLKTVRGRLKQKGVYSQWMPVFGSNPQVLFSVLSNFVEVFPWVTLWRTGKYTYHIMASLEEPSNFKDGRIQSRFLEQQEIYRDFGLNHYQSVLGRQVLPPFTVMGLASQSSQAHSLDRPYVEFASNRSRLTGKYVDLNRLLQLLLKKPIPKGHKFSDFLYENLEESLSLEFFTDNVEYLNHRNASLLEKDLGFYFNKLRYLYQKNYPEIKALHPEKLKFLKALESPQSKFRPEDIKKLIEAYRTAVPMHLPIDIGNLINRLPEGCSSRECILFKKIMTQGLGSTQEK